MGVLTDYSVPTRKARVKAMAELANNTGKFLNLSQYYGGRVELVHAARKLASAVRVGQLDPVDM